VVLITATLSLTIVGVVLLSSPVFDISLFGRTAGPELARHPMASQVVGWVGEPVPGLKGLLTPVWGEPGPDLAHDRTLNEGLALTKEKGAALAFYRLLVFNTSAEAIRLPLADGALEIQPAGNAPPVRLASVAALVEAGRASPSGALSMVLDAQGTLLEAVVVPPGMMADLLVAFERRVGLEDAAGVHGMDGVAFARRRIPRGDLEALLLDPDVARIQDL